LWLLARNPLFSSFGLLSEDWIEHAEEIPGCGDIWMMIMGPDTSAMGEVGPWPEVFQGSVASTTIQLLGLERF